MSLAVRHPLDRDGEILEVAGVAPSSFVDGPGNRYVLFLQGCNFDCPACHNPTTIGRCDGCGVCIDVCALEALTLPVTGTVLFHPDRCDSCGDCLRVCPTDADPTIRPLPVDEVVSDIAVHAPFVSGVTVSGGEPTLQLDGLIRLFSRLRDDPGLAHLERLVDTNGSLDRDGWERLLKVIDGAMVDLKAASPERHRRLTGHDIEPVIESLRLLAERNKLTEVRLLVIEGETDGETELLAWAGIVRSVDPSVPVRLMPFRRQGTRPLARRWHDTTPEAIARARTVLAAAGLRNVR